MQKLLTVAALVIAATAATAEEPCPWAGKTHVAAANNGKLLLRLDATCSKVFISYPTSPNDAAGYDLTFNGRNWATSSEGEFGFIFDRRGRTIQLRVGVRRERLGWRVLN